MKPLTVVGLSFAVAVAGTWSQSKTITTRQIVGGAFLAIAISVMAEAQPKLAQQFSWLLLASSAGAYGTDLFTAVGEITTGKKTKKPIQPGRGPLPV